MVSDIPGTSNTAYATSATTGDNYGSSTAGSGYGSSTVSKVESMVPGTASHREREYEQGSTGLTSGSTYGSSTSGMTGGSTGLGSGNTPRPRLADDNASTASIKSGVLGMKSSTLTDPLSSGSIGSGITGSSLPDRSVGATGGNFGGEGDIYHRNESKSNDASISNVF